MNNWGRHRRRSLPSFIGPIIFALLLLPAGLFAQAEFEKHPIGTLNVTVGGGSQSDARSIEEYKLIAREAVGDTYSATKIRDAIEALYNTKRIDMVTVSANLASAGAVDLNFDIKRKLQAQKVNIEIGPTAGESITEQDLLLKLNLVSPGSVITEQSLRESADQILDYMRDMGYYRSTVTYEKRPMEFQNDVGVTFRITPNEPAHVSSVSVRVDGFTKPFDLTSLKLKEGGLYSRDRLTADEKKVRDTLRSEKFVAP